VGLVDVLALGLGVGEVQGRAEVAMASRRMAKAAVQWLVDTTDEGGCGGFRWGGEAAGEAPLLGMREPRVEREGLPPLGSCRCVPP
jgi:hypothetical protein